MAIENQQLEAQIELARRELGRRKLLDFIKYNFPAYVVNWHHRLIIEKLEAVERGEIKRLMVMLPPRHGKSEICSIQFPAWYLGRHPDEEIMSASYNADLAIEFGKKTRNLVRSREFGNVFTGIKLSEDSTAAGRWTTSKGGSYYATGIGGGLTGRGCKILLLDDPIKDRIDAESELVQKAMWDWYRSTARTRLNPGGAIVVIQTRWNDRDLAGRILEEADDGVWTILKFPAIATEDEPHRKEGEALWPEVEINGERFGYSLETLREIEKDIGPYDFSALYQQTPVDASAQEFKKEFFKTVSQEEVSKMNTRNFLTVDTAMSKMNSADYTAFCDNSVNSENFWHLKTWKKRIDPYELIQTLFALQLIRNYEKIGIEKTAYLEGLKPYIEQEQRKRAMFLPIVELKHGHLAKETRIRGLIPRYAAGAIFHIDAKELEQELLAFPKGRHDDIADACFVGETMILTKMGQRPIRHIKKGDYVLTRKGYKKVLHSWKTGLRPVVENIGLIGTQNHPIITKRGIVDLQYVSQSDILYTWNEKLSSIEERNIIDTQNQKDDNTAFIIGRIQKTTNAPYRFTDKYGLIHSVLFPKDFISIIKMATLLITKSLISKVFPHRLMQLSIAIDQSEELYQKFLLRLPEHLPINGTEAMRDAHGIESMLLKSHTEKKKNLSARSVGTTTKQQLKGQVNTVQKDASIVGIQEFFDKKTQITTRWVYNIEVEDAHEYFANGILVHNCAYQLQFDLAKRSEVHIYRPSKVGFMRGNFARNF